MNVSIARMLMTKQEIIDIIKTKIEHEGGTFNFWVIGITNDVKRDLFNTGKTSEQNGVWIYTTAENHDIAVEVKDHFIGLGAKEENVNGSVHDADIVFAYRKTP